MSYARDVESDLFKIFIKWAEKKPVLHQAGTKNKPAGNNALDSILSQVSSKFTSTLIGQQLFICDVTLSL